MGDSNVITENFFREIESNDTEGTASFFTFINNFYATMTALDTDYYEITIGDIITWRAVLDNYPPGATFRVELLTTDLVPVTVFDQILGNGTNDFIFNLQGLGFPTAAYLFKITYDAGTEGDYRFKVIVN